MVGLAVWYDVDENKVTNLETQPLAKYMEKATEITDWVNGELKERIAACLEAVDAITPVLVEWIENDGVIPEPAEDCEGDDCPPAEEPAAKQRFKSRSGAKDRVKVKKVGKTGVRQDEEGGEEEGPAPQDIIKPVTDLVEAAYEIIDTNFDEISEQLNKFKKETFRMEKEIGIKKKKAVKIGSFKTKRMLNKNKNK